MNRTYPHIMTRIFDQPLLIEQAKFEVLLHVGLGPMTGIVVDGFNGMRPDYARHFTQDQTDDQFAENLARMQAVNGYETRRHEDGYLMVGDVAVIRVHGTLIQRGDSLDAFSGMLGYNRISAQLDSALRNAGVRSVLLSVDSPGGEIHGAFDLSDRIFEAREEKKIVAAANDVATSAAYLLASAASEVVVSRTSVVGSIGVVVGHIDWSERAKQQGIAHTYIFAGKHKVDGNPWEPLPDDVRERVQANVDKYYGLFVDTVARYRGLEADAVRGTEALTYHGDDALSVPLVDRVESFDATLTDLLNPSQTGAGLSMQSTEVATMTTQDKTGKPAAGSEQPGSDQDKGVVVPAKAEPSAKDERARIAAILGSEEAKGREQLAHHLAFNTDQDTETVIATLKASPKQAKGGDFLSDMQGTNPGVAPDQDGDGGSTQARATADALNPHAIYERRRQASAQQTH